MRRLALLLCRFGLHAWPDRPDRCQLSDRCDRCGLGLSEWLDWAKFTR